MRSSAFLQGILPFSVLDTYGIILTGVNFVYRQKHRPKDSILKGSRAISVNSNNSLYLNFRKG